MLAGGLEARGSGERGRLWASSEKRGAGGSVGPASEGGCGLRVRSAGRGAAWSSRGRGRRLRVPRDGGASRRAGCSALVGSVITL